MAREVKAFQETLDGVEEPYRTKQHRPRRSHEKGYEGERPIELLLAYEGYEVYRPRAGRPRDRGDIVGVDGVVISVKNHETSRLAGWLDAVQLMKANADKALGVVWHKRRRHAQPTSWYVTMTGSDFLTFLYCFQMFHAEEEMHRAKHPLEEQR